MTARRTDMHRLQELVRLHRLGRSAGDIARALRLSRNTVRGYLAAFAAAGVLEGDPDGCPHSCRTCSPVSSCTPIGRPIGSRTRSITVAPAGDATPSSIPSAYRSIVYPR